MMKVNSLDNSDSNENLLPQDKLFKEDILHKLIDIREEIQALLFDTTLPERELYVQEANFIYELITIVKNGFTSPKDVLEFIQDLEVKYPLANNIILRVKK